MSDAQERPPVLTDVVRDVWRITLDRPDTGNAVDPALAEALAAAFADRPPQTRAVLLLGNGSRFCVGGDVHSFADAADPRPLLGQLAPPRPHGGRPVPDCSVPRFAR